MSASTEESAGGRWKSRYLGAVEAQERIEREAGTRVGELGSLMVRLSRTLPPGESAALEKRLSALVGALKRRPLDPDLSRDLRDLHGRVLDVMDACDRERASLHGALGAATGALEALCPSRAFKRRLKAFHASIARREPPPASELVRSLAELQAEALEGRGREAPSVARLDPATAVSPVLSAPERAIGEASASAATSGEPHGAPLAADGIDWPAVKEVLAELVARLEVGEGLRQRIKEVTRRLENELSEESLFEVLASIRDLMDTALAGMTLEFQGFLDSVDRRLDALLGALGRAREDGRAALAMERGLSDSFQASLTAMRSEAAAATRLDELKSSIDSHLVSLVSRVEAFSQGGGDRESARDAGLAAMEQRLRELESESREARGQLEVQRQLARTDALTGLPNRKAMDERLGKEIQRAASSAMPLAVALADIDHFKAVNDRYGHQAGDRALVLFAGILSRRIRQSDFCARFGGEEFLLLFPGTDAATALAVLEELRAFVEGCGFSYKGEPVPLTASFGVTNLVPGEGPGGVLERTDRALYAAKSAGRNRVFEEP